ncbi:DUF1576 domain-containing protein [Carnobacterium mobile]|uniref:DUF1576 domain-containing protein n=1 Tax=Carnobacterium mobile TaxID=2750 RepID=UPI00068AF2FA|nr:DUF1576 domain-containing protein [Carnobacterium mobile]
MKFYKTTTVQTAGSEPNELMTERVKYSVFLAFGTFLFLLAFAFNSPKELWEGSLIILTSPAKLVTDYFELANIGSALLNASLMTFKTLALIRLSRVKINGPLIAALFTVAGFSLFGKNLYNSLPIILGVYGYAKIVRVPFSNYLLPALFGTALGPVVSEITFNLDLPLTLGIILGVLAGFLIGFLLPPLAKHFAHFHQGFSLYNIGFTAGIIGTFFISMLRSFGIKINTVEIVSSGHNQAFAIILYGLFLVLFLIGLIYNQWNWADYRRLLQQSGRSMPDFSASFPFGLILTNMALLGTLSTSYVLLVGGELNGPIIGGIFTIVGFGAAGKHLKNVAPIFLGVFVVGLFNASEINSTSALLAALFGTTLAPISGYYGPLAGVIAGAFHMALVLNISYLHAGMNLYNNGFSGGFIAALLAPIFDLFATIRKDRKMPPLKEPPADTTKKVLPPKIDISLD